MSTIYVNGKYVPVHDASTCNNEDENQQGVLRCARCNKITNHPIDEAIEVKVGDYCHG